jgi:gamma-glutamylcyclotransferase (GGCT)/AIG2-like uncharacterized protein YtfP
MNTFNLFTYGTLLRGSSAAGTLLDTCTNIGPAFVNGILYDIDKRYPAVVLYGEERVYGEVWRCPSPRLLELDEYEGVQEGLFRRVALEVSTLDGSTLPCWLYAAGPALSRKLVPERRIKSGRYGTHAEEG